MSKQTITAFSLLILVFIAAASAAGQTVPVGNVEELYAAVNDPANAGATVALAPGVYTMTANAPSGAARPNRGRLELQENMSLLGVVDDRNAVVIDAFNLPLSSYQTPGLTGAIRIGRGSNAIEWVTVKNAVSGSANIETDLIWPGTAYVRVAHIVSTNAVRGIDVRNLGTAAAGAIIIAEIVENDLFSNRLLQAEGMRFGNNLGANGASVFATLQGNRSFDNYQGMLVENNRTNLATVSITSSGDRFFENGAGVIILAGLSFNSVAANGNTINFMAHGSRFENNNGFTIFDLGGLVIVGGENTSIPNGTNNNTVNASLWGCRLSENQLWDLGAIGGRSNPLSAGSPGMNNNVTIEIHGEGKPKSEPVEFFANSVPFDANTTNSVTVIR
jgi:hypothetical protein